MKMVLVVAERFQGGSQDIVLLTILPVAQVTSFSSGFVYSLSDLLFFCSVVRTQNIMRYSDIVLYAFDFLVLCNISALHIKITPQLHRSGEIGFFGLLISRAGPMEYCIECD